MKNLKNIITFLLVAATAFSGCKPELLGPLDDDGTAPDPVKNVSVENRAGSALIKYTLPDNTNLLYVKAEYEINGVKMETKSSAYKNSMLVEGFGDTKEREVTLYAVSRSEKPSTPVKVKINPLTPAVMDARTSLTVLEAFGGINVSFTNTSKANIVIGVLLWNNTTNEWNHIDNFYTALEKGDFSVRGLQPVEQKFGVFVKDRWDNKSDTLVISKTPIFEIQLDKKLIKDIRATNYPVPQVAPLPISGAGLKNFVNYNSTYIPALLFDENYGNFFHTKEKVDQPFWMPLDLGVKVKLSRFKLWQRKNFEYNHGNPHSWEIWGTNTPADANSWKLLGTYKMTKPSGSPVGINTNDDLQAANNGHEYDFPITAPEVRYISWKHIDSWGAIGGGTGHLHMAELTFWGQPK